jgi:hypothetical protein
MVGHLAPAAPFVLGQSATQNGGRKHVLITWFRDGWASCPGPTVCAGAIFHSKWRPEARTNHLVSRWLGILHRPHRLCWGILPLTMAAGGTRSSPGSAMVGHLAPAAPFVLGQSYTQNGGQRHAIITWFSDSWASCPGPTVCAGPIFHSKWRPEARTNHLVSQWLGILPWPHRLCWGNLTLKMADGGTP